MTVTFVRLYIYIFIYIYRFVLTHRYPHIYRIHRKKKKVWSIQVLYSTHIKVLLLRRCIKTINSVLDSIQCWPMSLVHQGWAFNNSLQSVYLQVAELNKIDKRALECSNSEQPTRKLLLLAYTCYCGLKATDILPAV